MKHKGLLILASAVLCLSSCSMDHKIFNDWQEDDFWADYDMTTALLTSAYAEFETYADSWDGNFLDAATDNAMTRVESSKVYKASQGGITPSSNPLGNWELYYKNLQRIHIFMDKGLADNVCYDVANVENDPIIKQRMLGEAYFLRAYTYFCLIREYGGKTDDGKALGVPIVTKYVTVNEAVNADNYKRATYEECIQQIVSDCEKAIELLPLRYTGSNSLLGNVNVGRASGISAAALKLRALVYAASPAYQDDAIVRLDGMGKYTIVNKTAYKAKWERAAKYGSEVIGLLGNSFTALKSTDLCNNTSEYFSAEFLFQAYNGNNHNYETRHYPPFFYGSAQTTPSQNLADAFPAKNGYPITDPRSGYDESNPYACARDSRFDLNLCYQGKAFGKSVIDVAEGGKDSQYESNFATRTGYYLGKFLNISETFLNPTAEKNSNHVYPLLRAGEVWMNFAEASFEAYGAKVAATDCGLSAYDVIKTVRSTSGGITDTAYLDECAADEASFRSLIQNERRIEFAFENQRFWDMRRWLLPLNETIKGMQVKKDASGNLTYAVTEVQERQFNNVRDYYFPIPKNESLKSSSLVNNMGW